MAQSARTAVPEKLLPLEWCSLLRKPPEGQTAAVKKLVAAGPSLAAVALVAAAFAVAAFAVVDIANNLSWPTPRPWFAAKLAVFETLAIVGFHMAVADTANNYSPRLWFAAKSAAIEEPEIVALHMAVEERSAADTADSEVGLDTEDFGTQIADAAIYMSCFGLAT